MLNHAHLGFAFAMLNGAVQIHSPALLFESVLHGAFAFQCSTLRFSTLPLPNISIPNFAIAKLNTSCPVSALPWQLVTSISISVLLLNDSPRSLSAAPRIKSVQLHRSCSDFFPLESSLARISPLSKSTKLTIVKPLMNSNHICIHKTLNGKFKC